MEIRIECGKAKDKFVSDCFLLARLEFSEDEMTVTVEGPRGASCSVVCQIWEHTVYELENLAVALKVAGQGRLDDKLRVKASNVLIGPEITLMRALSVGLGQPLPGKTGTRAEFICSAANSGFAKRRLVFLDVICGRCGAQMAMEVEEALRLSEVLYGQARALARDFL
jgi:hypothetical protein